jgi:hypothetical protein
VTDSLIKGEPKAESLASLSRCCVEGDELSGQHNKDALILQEIQNKKQNDQISSVKNKISNLEKRLEEQEQYSRRTSLRFSNVRVPTNGNNVVKTPCVQKECIFLSTRKVFNLFNRSYLCLVKFSVMKVLST